MSSYFPTVPEIKFEGAKSRNPFALRFYDPEEVVGGKTMREQLRFAMSWWHTLCAAGNDPFGAATMDRGYGQSDEMARAKARADAGFEFMEKLGIDFFCFHDADIAPAGRSLDEFADNVALMSDYIKGKADASGKKLLWGTANLFNHPRYMHGAGTSPYPEVYACAACQIKNAIDATIKLGGDGYVFWGGREGYETLLNTDMGFELDNMARLMHMAVDYARSHGFKGYFYIEPKPKEPTKHQYDFDAATAAGFLQKYGLAEDFRLNLEANHATLAGHSFQHDLRVARVNGLFGSIDANTGDPNLGWDTDQFPTDVRDTTLCMYEVLKEGGFTKGGLNFDAKVRRPSYEYEDIAHAYLSGMDAFALGLKNAQKLIDDGRIDEFLAKRYFGWSEGLGSDIIAGRETLESLERHARGSGEPSVPSGRQEYLENVLNSVIYG